METSIQPRPGADSGTPPSSEQKTLAEFSSLAIELFALQYASNETYGKVCDARGLRPENLGDWMSIPALPTSAFKQFEITSLSPNERTRVFHSSGTTAQIPGRHFHNAASLLVYEESLWSWFEARVLRAFAAANTLPKLHILTPPPSEAPCSSLVYMLDVVRQKMGASNEVFLGCIGGEGEWNLDCALATLQLRHSVQQGRPLLALGTAFSFVHLLDFLRESSIRMPLPAGSRVFETGGYKGRSRELSRENLHQLIHERLGVGIDAVICEYGMCELSSQAYDVARNGPRFFEFPPWARARVLSPETGLEVAEGEIGLLRVYDLANVFSVFGVQTEDLARRHEHGFTLVGRASTAELRGCSLMASDQTLPVG